MTLNELFIPALPNNFAINKLFNLFYDSQIATISEIYYISRETRGELYNDIYISIHFWNDTEIAYNFIQRLRKSYATFIYDNFEELSCKVYIRNHTRPFDGELIVNYYQLLTLTPNPTCFKKLLIINNLLNKRKCFDIHDEIKSYLFIDQIYSDARTHKKNFILNFDQYFMRLEDNEENGYWSIRYGIDINFECKQCILCGGFEFISGPVFENVAPRALCSCPGFMEYYLQEIANLNELLFIFD